MVNAVDALSLPAQVGEETNFGAECETIIKQVGLKK